MPELEPLPHHTEVGTIEFDNELTEGEQVAVVCMYVLADKIAQMAPYEREPLGADIQDIAACETIEEAMGSLAMLEDVMEGDLETLFDALVVAGVVEGIRPGGDRQRSVTLGKNLLQLPLS